MVKSGIFILIVGSLSLVSALANAQRRADSQAGPATRGGQDLSTMGAGQRTTSHPAQGFEAERLARARRQAEFSHNFPGTPLRPLAEVPRIRNPGGPSNGAL